MYSTATILGKQYWGLFTSYSFNPKLKTLFLLAYVGYIRPSQELLDYYRCKIAEYDSEYEQLMEKLEKYKSAYEHLVR